MSNQSLASRLIFSCKDLGSLHCTHARIMVMGMSHDIAAMTALINAYSSFNRSNWARSVFESVLKPCTVLCNSMIRAYTRQSLNKEAMQLYHEMINSGVKPDKYTYTFVLRACTGNLDLERGVDIHRRLIDEGLESDVFIATGLVDMYSKGGMIGCARELFDKMPTRDVVTWNSMIAGYSRSEEPRVALFLFRKMQLEEAFEPNSVSLLNLYPAVCKLEDIRSCRSIHCFVIKRDFKAAVFNGLIDTYCKCIRVDIGRIIFNRLGGRDDVSWGTMMSGYAHNGWFEEVLDLFDQMQVENRVMNKVSAVSSSMAASELKDLEKGIAVHKLAMKQNVDLDVSVATSIMTMYAKCGELSKAKELFHGLKEKDLVAWSALVAAFAQSSKPKEALDLFHEMVNQKVKPNTVTLMSILPACAELSYVKLGRSIHCYAVKGSYDHEVSTGSALVSMYAKCGLFAHALSVFKRMPHREITTWNALINGYAQMGYPYHVMKMFFDLREAGIKPDAGTMVGLLPACALARDLNQGMCVHCLIMKSGFESDFHVKNSLIDMYAKCGRLPLAEYLFNDYNFVKDEVSWNSIIAGYAQNGCSKEAISAFCKMKLQKIQPNLISIVSILPAIADLMAMRLGTSLHAYIVKKGFMANTLVGNSLIDMYAKCGRVDCSELYFYEMGSKDTVSWNAMLAGYAMHGDGEQAIKLFSIMQEDDDVKVDSVSFLSVLSACRHAGMVDEGKSIISIMSDKYHLEPKTEHCACLVDLLGRSGLFDEAMRIINEMPNDPDAAVWGALLGACRMHSKADLAERALDQLVRLEPTNTAHYVGLSNIYAQSGRWADARETMSKLTDSGLKKVAGTSWI